MSEIPTHPAANIFPLLNGAQLDDLAQDILDNGQREPIKLLGGKILDGRHRMAACDLLQIKPKFVKLPDDTNPWAYVWSLNGSRRDLSTDQRYLCFEKCVAASGEFLAELQRIKDEANAKRSEAAKDQHKVSNPRAGEAKPDSGGVTNSHTTKEPNRTNNTKAAAAGVGAKTVNDCDWLQTHRPDLLARVEAGEFGSAKAKKMANDDQKRINEATEAEAAQKLKGCTARVVLADCVDIIGDLAPIDLLIADPPYFTDGDFTGHVSACLKRVKPTGQAYIFASADPAEVAAYILTDPGHMVLAQMLVWNYNNGGQRQPNERYNSNYQVIFYYRGPDALPINKPSDGKEQYACQTINAPDARLGDRWHQWQKPTELLNRLIRNSSEEGDFVFDPFVGSGTTVLAAAALGRQAFGCDTDPAAIDICIKRGCVSGN